MLNAKQELLAALAAELEKLQPGAGSRAAFESPKVAAHGDFACTAAMQLAKGLKQNPRALGEALREALLAPASVNAYASGSLGFEAIRHEGLALVALEAFGFGVGVAGFHAVWLAGLVLGGRVGRLGAAQSQP